MRITNQRILMRVTLRILEKSYPLNRYGPQPQCLLCLHFQSTPIGIQFLKALSGTRLIPEPYTSRPSHNCNRLMKPLQYPPVQVPISQRTQTCGKCRLSIALQLRQLFPRTIGTDMVRKLLYILSSKQILPKRSKDLLLR